MEKIAEHNNPPAYGFQNKVLQQKSPPWTKKHDYGVIVVLENFSQRKFLDEPKNQQNQWCCDNSEYLVLST